MDMESRPDIGMQSKLGLILTYWKFPTIFPIVQFFSRNDAVFRKNNVSVIVTVDSAFQTTFASDKQFSSIFPDYAKWIAYPEKMDVLCLGKANNFAIRNSSTDIIMKTDPDIVFSDESLQYAIEVCSDESRALVQLCANIFPNIIVSHAHAYWPQSLKRKAGYGASFTMHKEAWKKLKGYDERLDGWGADDFEMGH